MRALLALALSGCTLVVGSDPRLDADGGTSGDAAVDVTSSDANDAWAPDALPPDVSGGQDAAAPCDANGCNATKDACKKTCGDDAKQCNDACTPAAGKPCHDLCDQQMMSCNNTCLVTCLQCVMGCGTCGP
ncbi:MAG TPA: hypothetical protein VH054_01010 [Polyangiaceae bacterium]|jgi:hypothetical protein|nr:hypothetical protein [Polyangiaceae bacterium]